MSRYAKMLIAVSAYLLILPGCGPSNSSRVDMGKSTPLDLVRSYQLSVSERDYASILDCMVPELRREAEPMMSVHREFVAEGTVLEKRLRAEYGPEKAKYFREGMYQSINRMFDGVLLWIGPDGEAGRGAKITQSGNLARVEVLDRNTGIEAIRYDEHWLIRFAPDKMSRCYLDAYQRMLRESIKEFDHITRGIRDGTITDKNIDSILSGVQAPPGVIRGAIRVSP